MYLWGMGFDRRVRFVPRPLLLATLAFTCACHVHGYEERPLDPERTAAELAARRLDAPELAEFARLQGRTDFPPESWDLEALGLAAFWFRAPLEVARAELETARAATVTAGTRPNPSLSLDPEVVPGATHPWILAWRLAFPLETAGKRSLRLAAAEEDVRLRTLALYQEAWRVRAEVAAAAAELVEARGAEHLLVSELELRTELRELLGRRVGAGRDARGGRLVLAELEAKRVAAERETARTRTARAWSALAAALGVLPEALDGLALEADEHITELPVVPDAVGARDLGLRSRLDLFAGLTEYARAETELRLAVAGQYPDLKLAPGTSWDQGDHKYALGFELELPLFDRNQGPIAEAEARRAAAGSRFLALQQAAMAAIEDARTAYAGLLRESQAAEAVLATARFEEQRVTRALEAGGADRLELLEARLASLEAQRRHHERVEAAVRARLALENELQRPLEETFDPTPVLQPR